MKTHYYHQQTLLVFVAVIFAIATLSACRGKLSFSGGRGGGRTLMLDEQPSLQTNTPVRLSWNGLLGHTYELKIGFDAACTKILSSASAINALFYEYEFKTSGNFFLCLHAYNNGELTAASNNGMAIKVNGKLALTSITDRIYHNANYAKAGTALDAIDINGPDGTDDHMTYTCTFDTTADDKVEDGRPCDLLPGAASFSPTIATFGWTPNKAVDGIYEIKISGSDGEFSGDEIFLLQVVRPYPKTNLLVDLQARYATGTANKTGTPDKWEDLTTNNFDATITGGVWAGDGTATSPYSLKFDGATKADLGAAMTDKSKGMFAAWISPTQVAQGRTVILSTGGGYGRGLVLQQSLYTPGALQLGTGNYRDVIMGDAPVGYWRLGETTGATAKDETTNALDGAYVNTSLGQAGATSFDTNVAAGFDGTTSAVVIPDNALLRPTAITVEAWVKPTGTNGGTCGGSPATTQQILFKRNVNTANFEAYNLQFTSGTGTIRFVMHNGAATQTIAQGVGTITLNQWHHVVGVFEQPNLSLYVNGVLVGTATHNFPLAHHTRPLFIGRTGECGGAGEGTYDTYFNGQIDEVAVYDRALNANDVKRHYAAGAGCTATTAIANGEWAHVAGTYDGTDLKMYINGRNECTVSPGTSTFSASTNLILGATATNSANWQGALADLQFYSEGTPAHVESSFFETADKFRQTPVGSVVGDSVIYHLDAANADNGRAAFADNTCAGSWYDLSKSGATNTLTSFAACGDTEGWNGTGTPSDPYRMTFDGDNGGTGNRIVITNATALNNLTLTDFTVSAWIYDEDQTAGWFATIISNTNAMGGWSLRTTAQSASGPRQLLFSAAFNPGTGMNIYSELGSIQKNRWTHVAATYNAATKSGTLYIDGAAVTSYWSYTAGSGTQNDDSALVKKVGQRGNAADQSWHGSIGNIMIHSRALSASEVSQNCYAQLARYAGATCL